MSYDELSLYGRLRKQSYCGPYSMFCKLLHVWSDKFSPEKVNYYYTFLILVRIILFILG